MASDFTGANAIVLNRNLMLTDSGAECGGGGGVLSIVFLFIWLFSGDDKPSGNSQENTSTQTVPHSSEIDWSGDKGHILNGSKNHPSHKPGWQKFGIDPNGNDAWPILLKLFQDAVDNSDRIIREQLPSGDWLAYYYKMYEDKGVELVVKIWEKADGTIEKLSDAWAQIIGE